MWCSFPYSSAHVDFSNKSVDDAGETEESEAVCVSNKRSSFQVQRSANMNTWESVLPEPTNACESILSEPMNTYEAIITYCD